MKKESNTSFNRTFLNRLRTKAGIAIFCSLLSFPLFAQITVKVNNQTIKQTLRTIESKSNYKIFFSSQLPDLEKNVNLDINNQSIDTTLSLLFKKTRLSYEMKGNNQIVVIDASTKQNTLQKEKEVSGIVTDEKGEPVIGANVSVKGTTIGTISDAEGHFNMTVPENSILTISYIGYVDKAIQVKDKTTFSIALEENTQNLDEVVVVGYGVQKKAVMTGAVSTIGTSDIRKSSTSNLSNALVGRLPGLIAVNGTGEPGVGSKLLIRGMGTWNNSDPLVMVDGIERDMKDLDPNEIENISILKDAAASAVYGARAANGVVLITTKRGKTGKPTIKLDTYYGINNPTRYPELANSYEYASMKNKALEMDGVTFGDPRYFTPEQLEKFRSGQIDTNWYDETFKKTAAQYYANASVSGGSETVKYFVALGHRNEDALVDNYSYKQYNFRSNIDAKITERLNLSADVDLIQQTTRSPGYGVQTLFNYATLMQPQLPSYHPDGKAYNVNGAHTVEMVHNSGNEKTGTNNARVTFKADYAIPGLEGLSAKGMFSYGKSYSSVKKFFLPYTLYDENEDGVVTNTKVIGEKTTLDEGFNQNSGYSYNVQLNYARMFGKHDVGALFLYEEESRDVSLFSAYRTNFITNAIPELFAGGDSEKSNTGSASEWARNGLVGRVNYAYDSKYMLEASFRYDGSITFPKGKRYGFFPSVSAAWRISSEPFIRNNFKWIDNLKIRASYGTLGNDQVDLWQYLSVFTFADKVTIGGVNQNSITTYKDLFPNPDITWEKSSTFDIGVEGTLWNGLLGFELDYFNKKTTDILSPRLRSIPETFGATLPDENYGILRNQGVEIVMNHFNRAGSDFTYHVGFNFSFSRNKVIAFDESESTPDYNRVVGRSFTYTSGRRPYAGLVGMKAVGLFQSQEEIDTWPQQFNGGQKPGDIKYVDVNGDGVVNEDDMIIVDRYGNIPEIVYGVNLGAGWKGLELSVLFQGAGHKSVILDGFGRTMLNQGNNNFFKYLAEDTWTPENTDAKYPRPYVGVNNNNHRNSAIWLRDASYLRLKNIELSYTLPRTVMKKIRVLNEIRVYASGTNLLTFDKLKVMDPESSSASAQYYPQQKSVNFGISIIY